VILATAAALGGAGGVLFLVGFSLGRPELAMFGAILVIGVGAAGAAQGFTVKTGEETHTETRTEAGDPQPIGNASRGANLTHPMDAPGSVQAGGGEWGPLWAVERAGRTNVTQLERFDFNREAVVENGTLDVSRDIAGAEIHGLHLALDAGAEKRPENRGWLYTVDAGNSQLVQYELGTGGEVRSASLSDTLAYDSLQFTDITTPRKVYAHPGGELLYVIDYFDDVVHVLRMDSPHALSTAEEVDQIDASGETSGQWDVALTSDGLRMFLVDRGTDEVVGYQLPSPYDFENRTRTQSTLELPAEDADPNGGWVFANDTRLALSTGTQANLVEYRLRTGDETTYNVTENTYSRVELHRKFPLGAFVLLLGVLMLMGSAGRASEETMELG